MFMPICNGAGRGRPNGQSGCVLHFGPFKINDKNMKVSGFDVLTSQNKFSYKIGM